MYDYNHQLQRQKDQNNDDEVFEARPKRSLSATPHKQTITHVKDSSMFNKNLSQNDLILLQRQHQDTHSSMLIPSTNIVRTLNTNFSSLDEIELTRFLRDRKSLNKSERSFLQKYIIKGLPEKLRGKDLSRTFANESFFTLQDSQDSIERILQAYVRRNPSIGYCQGMNFIVGRLRKYLSEEETFWLFTMIIECYLPFDYFEMMVGVLIDQKVFMKFVESDYKELFVKFKDLGFDFSILAFQWFVCIFTYNMPEEILEPSNSIFGLHKKIIETALNYKITNEVIKNLRTKYTEEALSEIREYESSKQIRSNQMNSVEQLRMSFKNQKNLEDHMKLRFLQKFPLFNNHNKQKSTVTESEENQGEFFYCNHAQWPRCIFDFTYNQVLPQYFVFKAHTDTYKVLDNYFYIDPYPQPNQNFGIQESSIYDTLIVERNYHPCSNKDFKKRLIDLYIQCNEDLLTCTLLNAQLCTDFYAKARVKEFMNFVLNYREPLKVVQEVQSESSMQDEESVINSINRIDSIDEKIFIRNDYEDDKFFQMIDSGQKKDELQEWISSFVQDTQLQSQTMDITNDIDIKGFKNIFGKHLSSTKLQTNQTDNIVENTNRTFSYQLNLFAHQNSIKQNQTSVGALINQRSFNAFINKHDPQRLNEKQTMAMRQSTIIAFNNNFL